MGKASFTTFLHLLLVLVVFCSVKMLVPKVEAKDCEISWSGGGCPDSKKCLETCRPCYVGIGKVVSWCYQDFAPFWRCICSFSKGVPCPPFDGCRPPQLQDALSSNHTNNVNRTLN
ncbi:hypothetical protein ACFX2I_012471 [Malus domestica]